MIRQVIKIDQEKCIGCGLCAEACHEKAIEIVNGKAQVIKYDYCDGMGDCLPHCPVNAISFVNLDTASYDHQAVQQRIKALNQPLENWPIQIKLASINSASFNNADLLIAADCTGYAYRYFHEKFIKNHVTLIGCSKLDNIDYSEKLSLILSCNNIKSITLTKMTVPCCNGLLQMVKKAIELSQKEIPLKVYTINQYGEIIDEQ